MRNKPTAKWGWNPIPAAGPLQALFLRNVTQGYFPCLQETYGRGHNPGYSGEGSAIQETPPAIPCGHSFIRCLLFPKERLPCFISWPFCCDQLTLRQKLPRSYTAFVALDCKVHTGHWWVCPSMAPPWVKRAAACFKAGLEGCFQYSSKKTWSSLVVH